jgi:hypothetical protein
MQVVQVFVLCTEMEHLAKREGACAAAKLAWSNPVEIEASQASNAARRSVVLLLSKKLLLLCCFLYAHGVSWRPQQKPKAVSFSNFIFCKRLCYLFGLSLKSRLHAWSVIKRKKILGEMVNSWTRHLFGSDFSVVLCHVQFSVHPVGCNSFAGWNESMKGLCCCSALDGFLTC